MKKIFSIMCLMLMALVSLVSCDQKCTNGTEPIPIGDSCLANTDPPGVGYNFEGVLTCDTEFIYDKHESSVFYGAQATLDYCVDDTTDLNVVGITTIFQSFKEPKVIIIDREGVYGEEPGTLDLRNTLWKDCKPIKLPTPLTLKQAIEKLNQSNSPKPHSDKVVLKNPFKASGDSNPIYIFGEKETGYIAVDAVTGEVGTYK